MSRIPPAVVLEALERDDGCLAPRLGGSYHDCWGRNRVEHVKKEPRMARRAEHLAVRVVVLCQGHTEDGMRAGYVWATDSVNRGRCRAYLAVYARFRLVCRPAAWQAFLGAPRLDGATAWSLLRDDRVDELLAGIDALGEGVFV
jgi:hypothetical protein